LKNYSEINLQKIYAHSIPSLHGLPIEIYPFYDGLNLANIPNSICHWFGIPSLHPELIDLPEISFPTGQIKNIILLLIDGLSFERMRTWLEDDKFSHKLNTGWKFIHENALFTPLTSVIPSTTANALTCLWTGCFPGEHGVVGYEVFLKEYQAIVNMILQTPVYPPELDSYTFHFPVNSFLTVPTLGSYFKKHHIHPYAFQHESIYSSGLSRMLFPEVDRIAFSSPVGMWKAVDELLDLQDSNRKYIYLYWSELDTLSHRQGPNGKKARDAWQWFSHLLVQFISQQVKKKASDTLFLITSDHGQIPSNISPKYEIRNDQQFMGYLMMPPSGESRLPYVFVKEKKQAAFQQYLQQRWADEFTLVPTNHMIASGIFGTKEITSKIRSRMGNFIALPRGNAYWWWADKDNHLLGRHGGFSAQEMLTPFLLLSL